MPEGTGDGDPVKTVIAVRATKRSSSAVAGRGGLETISARDFRVNAGPCQCARASVQDGTDPQPADRRAVPAVRYRSSKVARRPADPGAAPQGQPCRSAMPSDAGSNRHVNASSPLPGAKHDSLRLTVPTLILTQRGST